MKAAKEEMPPVAPRPVHSDIYPLDEFYAERGEAMPVIERVEPDEVPEPYRSLLVHKADMTSTLERFHQETLHIEILARRLRRIRILPGSGAGPGSLAKARRIRRHQDLSRLVSRRGAVEEILRERQPLGRILNMFNIPFASRPGAFLRLASDKYIDGALQLQGPHLLHGRRNSLVDARERPLAEIVEILPP